MTRTIARLGVGVLLLTFALGCLINAPDPPPEFFSMIRIVPDQNLEAAPEGQVYELWTFDMEFRETTFVETTFNDDGSIDEIFEFTGEFPLPSNFESVVRFLWDPDNFQTLDENGNPTVLYSPTGKGLDIGRDLTISTGMLLSIEPMNDPNPEAINGPSILAYVSPTLFGATVDPLKENKSVTMRASDFIAAQPGGASFSLLAQTVQYQRSLAGEEVCWRSPNQGMGVWFAETQVRDLIVEDTAGYNVFDPDNKDTVVIDSTGEEVTIRYRGTLFTRDVDRNLDGIPYQVWIFPKQPELSWSNFDLNAPLFRFTTPDLVFRDGVAIHSHPLDNGPPDTGINAQASHPMVRGTDTIGFMYFNPDDPSDTCFLRIDHPESTYCQSESEELKFSEFSDTNLIIRQYTTTWGDTVITPSLRNLPASRAGGALAMEAWVIFDSASNPVHPPLSLGLFLSPFGSSVNDFNSLYYDAASADPNFTFPGEDFIDMSSRPDLPDSLDLLNFDGAERIKIWITIEPYPVDWAPDEPWTQLLTYVGEVLPDDPAALQEAQDICENRTENPTAPTPLNFPLQYRPLSVSKDDPAEGHNWPSMQIFIANPFEE